MKLKKETINNVHECCQCQYCGYPMYEGEIVFVDDEGTTFCGNYCFKLYHTHLENARNLIKEVQQ